MTFSSGDIVIPAERDDEGRMSVQWFQASVCAPHGRDAVQQLKTSFGNSFGNNALWGEAFSYAWFVKSVRDESLRRYQGISAVWPLCDVCAQRVRRTRITVAALAATWILSFIGAYAAPGALGVVLFFLMIIAFIGMAAVGYRFNRGGHSNSEANRDLTAVIVHSPHPNFYAEASRQIRMRGYGYPGSTGMQGYR